MNLKILLAYDGTDFDGWQVQPGRRTVQGVLEEAIHDMTGERPRLLCAGRTDAGVHALGQVASLETRSRIPPDKWRPALQVRLPRDLVILDVSEVPERFHATYSARSKRYRYVIYNSRVDDVFLRRNCWRVPMPLNVEAMQQAGNFLLGTHDFRSFETNWPNKATSVRTVMDLRVMRCDPGPFFQNRSVLSRVSGEGSPDERGLGPERQLEIRNSKFESTNSANERSIGHQPPAIRDPLANDQEPRTNDDSVSLPTALCPRPVEVTGGLTPPRSPSSPQPSFIVIEIEADGFLYNMVRTITGTLVNVGRGTWTPEDVDRILKAQDRMQAGDTSPAWGLYLVQVHYPSCETDL